MDAGEQLGMGFFDEVAAQEPPKPSRPRPRTPARDRLVADHPQTRVKLDAYDDYLPAWLRVAAGLQTTTDIYVLDLFAGPGRYPRGETGSPVIACEAARVIRVRSISRARPVTLHLRFVESDRETFARLQDALAPYRGDDLDIRTELGTAEQWAESFAAEAKGHPTLLFLDPDGYKDVPLSMVGLFGKWRFSEVLINFDQGTIRVAGIDDTSSLTAFYGDDWWRRHRRDDGSIDADVFLEGYRQRLGQLFPFTTVRRIVFHEAHANRALVQACWSQTGVNIWHDCFVAAYEKASGVLVLEIAREVDRRLKIDRAIDELRGFAPISNVRYGSISQRLGGLELTEDDRHQVLLFLRDSGVARWTSVLHKDAAPSPRFMLEPVPPELRWDGVVRPRERPPRLPARSSTAS
jgi:three-Cys-motif partner protein